MQEPQGHVKDVRYVHEVSGGRYTGEVHVFATFSDGLEYPLFSYWRDEIHVQESELVGKTYRDAVNVFTKKDIDYLQR